MTSNIKLACVMVGLPARGKTFISYKVSRYLQWLGIKTKIFDVDEYQRQLTQCNISHEFSTIQDDLHTLSGSKPSSNSMPTTTAAKQALDDMIEWFNSNTKSQSGSVAVYDGTNITKKKRKWIHDALVENHVQVLFIESLCDDEQIIRENIRNVKLTMATAATATSTATAAATAAAADLIVETTATTEEDQKRIEESAIEAYLASINKYKGIYETISEANYTYIKLINAGRQYVINMVRGYLESRIVYYLINLNIKKKKIWLSRHGESQFNVEDRIGGDADLSPRGQQYAKLLPSLVSKHIGDDLPLTVWTSTMKRTIQTAQYLNYPKKQWKALEELDTGVCDGMTYDEIAQKYPEDFLQRDQDKFNYRYRGGESYRDLVLRLEPVIMELEQHERILIVAHQATIRCLYAYFMNLDHEQLPYARVPLHTLIELTPGAYNCEEKLYKVDIEAVDTYRPKSAGIQNISKSSNKAGASGEISLEPILPLSPH